MIANDAICTHVKTERNPSFCVKQNVPSLESCKSSCTSYKCCIGFSYETTHTDKQRCHLWVSDKKCPPKFGYGHGESAITMYDLRGDGIAGHVCYAKNPGTVCCILTLSPRII